MNEPAIVALTPHGLELSQRLIQALGKGEIFSAKDSAGPLLRDLFNRGRPLVCIMALGIVVRILGPVASNKETDPAVVVVDEAGRFSISVLGGHGGGANELARQVAQVLGAVPVITTASDAFGLPAVDLIGKQLGWKIEDKKSLTQVAATVVRGEAIGVYQEAGNRTWWQEFGAWPSFFHWLDCWPPTHSWPGLLGITDRLLAETELGPTIIYRPPCLVLGVGCRRGTSCEEIEALFQKACQVYGFSTLCLGLVATATLKADEPGLLKFAAARGVPVQCFNLDELNTVTLLPTPSEAVRAKIGVPGVAEPAAMLAAGTRSLLIPKYRGRRLNLALARKEEKTDP